MLVVGAGLGGYFGSPCGAAWRPVALIGEGVDLLIAEAALALRLECSLEELERLIHPHPTLGENLREAAPAALARRVPTV